MWGPSVFVCLTLQKIKGTRKKSRKSGRSIKFLLQLQKKKICLKIDFINIFCYCSNLKQFLINWKEKKNEKFNFLKTIRILISVDYLLDCTSVWIQFLCWKDLFENEQISHSLWWWCLVVWNNNILQSLEMSLNHHHTYTICQGWNNISHFITVLIMV